MELRLSADEKQAFRDAAELVGTPLAAWARGGLRQLAARELKKARRSVAFLE